jgi:uncharacterized protein (DUF934 family)
MKYSDEKILRVKTSDLLGPESFWHEIAHWLGHDEGEVKELGFHLAPSPSMNVVVTKGQTPRVVALKFPVLSC